MTGIVDKINYLIFRSAFIVHVNNIIVEVHHTCQDVTKITPAMCIVQPEKGCQDEIEAETRQQGRQNYCKHDSIYQFSIFLFFLYSRPYRTRHVSNKQLLCVPLLKIISFEFQWLRLCFINYRFISKIIQRIKAKNSLRVKNNFYKFKSVRNSSAKLPSKIYRHSVCINIHAGQKTFRNERSVPRGGLCMYIYIWKYIYIRFCCGKEKAWEGVEEFAKETIRKIAPYLRLPLVLSSFAKLL